MKEKNIIISIIVVTLIIIVTFFSISFAIVSSVLNDNKCINEKLLKDGDNGYSFELSNDNNLIYNEISLKSEEDFIEFLSFVNNFKYADYRDSFLNSKIVDNSKYINSFKIAYVLENIFGREEGNKYFTPTYLNSKIEQAFGKGIDFQNGFHDIIYLIYSNYTIVCDKNVCSVNHSNGGWFDNSKYVTKIVGSKKSGDNTIYIIKEYYTSYVDAYGEVCDIYNKSEGEFLIRTTCSIDYEGLTKKVNPDKLNTYEITFDKDNRYVSGKKIN